MFMMRRTARIGSSTRGTSLRSYRDYGRGETNNIVFVDSKSVTLVQEHTPRRRGVSVPIEASECTGISPRYVFDLGDSGSAPRSRGAVTAALVVGGAVGAAALGAKLLRRRSRADAGSVGEDVISKLKTEEVESFHVSEISEEAIKGNWWKNLPFVCVLTFTSGNVEQSEGEWFSMNMGEEEAGKLDDHIVGFENPEDAKRFRYIISQDSAYAGKFPRVQVVSPQDLWHASRMLEVSVFVLHAGQFLPSPGDSLQDMSHVLHQCYYKERQLGIKFE